MIFVFFCVWVASHTIIYRSIFHENLTILFPFMAAQSSAVGINHIFLVHSSVGRHLDLLYFLSIMTRGPIIPRCSSIYDRTHSLLGTYPGAVQLGPTVAIAVTF